MRRLDGWMLSAPNERVWSLQELSGTVHGEYQWILCRGADYERYCYLLATSISLARDSVANSCPDCVIMTDYAADRPGARGPFESWSLASGRVRFPWPR